MVDYFRPSKQYYGNKITINKLKVNADLRTLGGRELKITLCLTRTNLRIYIVSIGVFQ